MCFHSVTTEWKLTTFKCVEVSYFRPTIGDIMWMFVQAIFTLWCVSLVFAIPLPRIGHVHICYDFQCYEELMTDARRSEALIVGLISHNIEKDPYCSLYIGWILDLFDIPELAVNTVIFQIPEGNAIEYAGARMIQLLPPRSIFVSHEHGMSSFGLHYLEQLKLLGVGPRVVFHMNHERPWNVHDRTDLNFIYNSTQSLIASYQRHQLVLRNYYYEPLVNHSEYVPLGPAFYSYLIGTPDAEFHSASLKLASQRSVKCHFAGRLKYFMTLENKTVIESDSTEHHIQQRRHLLFLSAEGRLGGCIAESSDGVQDEVGVDMYYRSYIEKMTETAFALCPAGNNPETFRLYEALELGAIPLMTRPPAEQDFLQFELWSDYPGPVFTDWSELEPFMLGMTPDKTDRLQLLVGRWYQEFKRKVKQRVKGQLKRALQGVSNLVHLEPIEVAAAAVVEEVTGVAQVQEQISEQPQVGHDEVSPPNIVTVESLIQHLYTQIESLHYRLSEVERELSGSLQREQMLLAQLKEKKIIE